MTDSRQSVAWVTAAACNYLPQLRVLARSFSQHHGGRRITALITDQPPDGVDLAAEPYDALFPADVGLPAEWRMTHTCKEFSAGAKAHLMLHALSTGADAVIFIDPDMIVLGAMDDVADAARRHALTLRPHFLSRGSRRDDLRAFVEDRVLQAGVYNGALIAATDTPEARAFLEWWAGTQAYGCRYELGEAQHFDQRWLDLAPSFVRDLGYFDDPGLDVAFWSLPGSVLGEANGIPTVDGHPVRLLHFTGFVAERPDVLVAYFDDLLQVDDVPALAAHYRDYVDSLGREGRSTWRSAPYGFGFFDDGEPVPDVARRVYAEMGPERGAFGDPFRTGAGTFREWLDAPVDDRLPAISREWMEAHGRRSHLQETFADPLGADRLAFHAWTQSPDAAAMRVGIYILYA